jgi:hypothetical protein
LKKQADSVRFRFYKPKTKKTKPNRTEIGKKPEKTEQNRAKTGKNRAKTEPNRFESVFALKN